MAKADAIIGRIIAGLDAEQAAHQDSYRRYHGCEDEQARHVHQALVSLCDHIRKELIKAGI